MIHQKIWSLIFDDFQICNSSLFIPLNSNSTVSEIISPCMALVFLPTILAVFSVVCLLFLIFYGYIILSPTLKVSKLLISKVLFILIIFVSNLIHFISTYFELENIANSSEEILGRIISVFIAVTLAASYFRCWQSGIRNSIWLHFIYFMYFLTLLPKIIVNISSAKTNFIDNIFLGIEITAVIFLNILFCFVDKFDGNYENFYDSKPVNPDRSRSSLARAFFAQAGYLMSKGYNGTLDYDSFWALDPQNQPERLLTFYTKYERKINEKTTKLRTIPWLFIILAKCTWFPFSAGAVLTILDVLVTLADPIFLKLIISSAENNYPLWYGFMLVVAYFIVSWVKLVTMARSTYYILITYLDVQSILINVIYRKMIKLSLSAKLKYSAGEVINLLTTDVERIQNFWFNLIDFIYSLLMIIFCLAGLSLIIGINVLYGIAVILSFFPLNGLLVKIATKCENRQIELKDERLKLMTDVLSGVKVLKLYAWEESMHARISDIRTKEVIQLKYATYCYAAMEITFTSCPILATIVSFIGYIIIQGNPLTPEVAFISLMLFNLMRLSIYRIPGLIQEIINAKISLNRVEEFLNEPEIPEFVNSMKSKDEKIVTEFLNASFSWSPAPIQPSNNAAEQQQQMLSKSLNNLSFKIYEGELIGIVGRVGSGKSSLLSSVCGELYHLSGELFRKSPISIAYVPQEAWIQNLSLRDNILFGKNFDQMKYQQTIDSCALKDDIAMLAAGDATEIGERGLNLSGGQKARVALARAVYQSSDLYILDDTLSAVDSHVGAHIFQNVIGNEEGILKDKTRIFALNSINFLPQCDRIIVMKEGEIVDIGTYEELLVRENATFIELVKELAVKAEKQQSEIDDETIGEESEDILNELVGAAQIREHNRSISTNNTDDFNISPIRQRRRTSSSNPSATIFRSISHAPEASSSFSVENNNLARLIEEEEIGTGKVSYKIYLNYAKAFGIHLVISLLIVLFVFRNFFESFSQIWIAKWSSSSNSESHNKNDEIEHLGIYAFFGISSCILGGLSSGIIAVGAFKASKEMHESLLFSLLQSPMSFFDTTPLGRILNRLSKDIEKIDKQVPQKLTFSIITFAECIFGIMMAIYVLPYLGILSVFVLIIFVIVVRYYTYASVQIRRLYSKSWSSVTSHAQDSYIGVNTLRVFGVQKQFIDGMLQKGVKSTEADLAEIVSNRWIQLRMDMLTSIFATIITLTAVYLGHHGLITAGLVGLITSTATMIRNLLGEIARSTKEMEMSIVAVERIQEYVQNEQEAEWHSTIPPPLSWPSEGVIKFKDLSLRYRPTTPFVLKNLNFEIAAKLKVGIVGRTGAGKTSLTMALFRTIEPAFGTIFIDGIDYRTLGLHDLRNAFTIIPQDPVLFCGNLRINLDPFEEFDDTTLWNAIEKAHLKQFVDQFPLKLQHEISEGGGNLSVGQRQLICLARAILRRKTKILVLDEATAAVDAETDQLIQSSIRSQFSQCTILTIAHRLNTIMDYDKILVMDAGEIREFDSPEKFLQNKNGIFYSLAFQSNLM